jgi:hypothetical protein
MGVRVSQKIREFRVHFSQNIIISYTHNLK